ncbi:hypothetical protein JCM11641_000873 [Rhodosporidiobolus odoratus]
MASERTPLLPPRPAGRALSESTFGEEGNEGTVTGTRLGARPGGRVMSRAASKQHYYDEDAVIKRSNVFLTIHRVYKFIAGNFDVALSDEQLQSPAIVINLIQPSEDFLMSLDEPCVVYALLLARTQFLRDSLSTLTSSSLNLSRANVCEVLAAKLLREQGSQSLLDRSRFLVGGFHAFQGASDEVIQRIREKEGYSTRVGTLAGAGKINALELAIIGKARKFIKTSITQSVIKAIYDGRVTYSSSSFIDILPDKWKNKEIALYDVHKAPLLDHYRLRVPKYRSIIEFASFLVLFASFILVIVDRHAQDDSAPATAISFTEVWFFIYSLGHSLDKIASILEHGWSVYAQGLTNGLDAACLPIYIAAFVLRVQSLITGNAHTSDRAFAILSTAACILFPRLAFTLVANNLLVLSLRNMIVDFLYLLSITVFCFVGFVFALNHLSEGAYSVATISEWLVFIFFGLDGSGIDESPRFDPVLGPILFISFAALSNTLLTSVLVAILSTTFAKVAEERVEEDMFRKAVAAFEGVKAGALFDYVPPFNLIALVVLWPLSHVLSPRWFHKINVLTTRLMSLPILILIALYERQYAQEADFNELRLKIKRFIMAKLPHAWARKLDILEGAQWECEAVFDYDVLGKEVESMDEEWEDLRNGPNEDEEEALYGDTEVTKRLLSQRASVFLDPARMEAARRQREEGQSGVASSTASFLQASTPLPLSRQPSFADDAEPSTIRAPKASPRPPIPGLPATSPPAASLSSSPLRQTHQEPDDTPEGVSYKSPPTSPGRRNAPPATRFAPLPPRDSPGAGTRELRRSMTTRERLPANAHSRRRSSFGNDAFAKIDFPEMSTSAPAKESPLARMYSMHPGTGDFDGLGMSNGGKGGAVRRRLSLGPATVQHIRGGSEGLSSSAVRKWQQQTAAATSASEPSTEDLMGLIQGLVNTVARLEKKLDEQQQKDE